MSGHEQVYLVNDCPLEAQSVPISDLETIEVYYYGDSVDEEAISG